MRVNWNHKLTDLWNECGQQHDDAQHSELYTSNIVDRRVNVCRARGQVDVVDVASQHRVEDRVENDVCAVEKGHDCTECTDILRLALQTGQRGLTISSKRDISGCPAKTNWNLVSRSVDVLDWEVP